jgi:cell division protein FtsA
MTNYLGALDIGSENTTFLLAKVDNTIHLIDYVDFPSQGVRKGTIEDSKALTGALKNGLSPLNKKHATLPVAICLSQTGSHIRNIYYAANLPLTGFNHVIEEQDITAVNQLAMEKKLPESQLFLHHFKQYYTVDNSIVDNPYGHSGNQLSVHYCGLLGDMQAIKNHIYMSNQFGFHVKELVFSGLASALATTTAIERENGVCVIDVGSEMTEFIAFKHQCPFALGTLPVGGKNFTYDLCSGLRMHLDDGEHIKIKQGIPQTEMDNQEEDFWVVGNQTIGDKKVKIKNVRVVLQARAQELFDYIQKSLKSTRREEELLAGYVLTGGGALLKNIEKTATQVFQCDCYVRGPLTVTDEKLQSPNYATCFGLLHYALQQQVCSLKKSSHLPLWKRLSSWFS